MIRLNSDAIEYPRLFSSSAVSFAMTLPFIKRMQTENRLASLSFYALKLDQVRRQTPPSSTWRITRR